MKKEIGLWIDQHKAVIVILSMKGEDIRCIESDIDKLARLAPGAVRNSSSEMSFRKLLENRLAGYYKRVFSIIRHAQSILIFGPGEAKDKLEEQLVGAGLEDHIVDIQTDGEMTDRQISAKVYRYFSNNRRSYLFEKNPESSSDT